MDGLGALDCLLGRVGPKKAFGGRDWAHISVRRALKPVAAPFRSAARHALIISSVEKLHKGPLQEIKYN
jgi:hypothetical protein